MGLRKHLSMPAEGFCYINWFDGVDWNVSKVHTSQLVTTHNQLVQSLAKACVLELFSSGEITLDEVKELLTSEIWITMAVDAHGRMFMADQNVTIEKEADHG